jgi:Xaa-Pro dipeptidase
MNARPSEVAAKLARVRTWLASEGLDGALFTTQPGVSWVTGGLEDRVNRIEEPGLVWVLVDQTSAHLITSNVEAPRVAAESDPASLGLETHVVPWYDPGGLADAVGKLGQSMRLANDGFGPGTPAIDKLASLRMPLTPEECTRLISLGTDCAAVLEGELRVWTPVERENELAGRISAALEERGVLPSVLLVGGSERRRLFRHPVPTETVTGADVLAVIVGMRGGLNVACSRTASAGPPSLDLGVKHSAACRVEAAMILATRPGATWVSVLTAGQAAYGVAGFPEEWRAHWQGGPIGYGSREFDVVPGTASAVSLIQGGSAFAWNPTVQGAKSEDTFIVTGDRPRSVSNPAGWPQLAVDTPSGALLRPGILVV